MADVGLTFLIEKVEQILSYYLHLISEAENELLQLKNELRLLKAFLLEAAKVPKKEEPFRELERQIRKVVYDAEDTVDSCLTQAAQAKGKSLFRRLNPKNVSLAEQVKSLREERVKPMFDTAKRDFATMKISDGSGTIPTDPSSKVTKPQFIRQDNVVGLDDEEKKLIDCLMEEKRELDVISIIGMPGLGKTTLAWKIYHNTKIRREFPTCIWVYVSQEFNMRFVLLEILKVYTNEDVSTTSDQELIQTVRGFLENGKFLLVMDDVWSTEAWDAIRHVLPKDSTMSKVLITSRHMQVGKRANNVTREPHMLRFLNEEESWELLQFEVFQNLDECPTELEVKGKDIANQCDGLPLALVVIGGILRDLYSPITINETLNAWEKVSQNVSTYVKNHDKEQRISNIVALSYNKLPDELRECFLYLGAFPEDYEIPAWTLTNLWIAEGFVQHKQGQSLEETSEDNLKELINRNLVMVEKRNQYGQVKTCRVHDVIRDFCISKAAPEEQDLFQEMKKLGERIFDPPVSDIHTYRRLCIHLHLTDFLKLLSPKLKAKGIRSFLCFYKGPPNKLDPKYISTIPDTFHLLRVLDSRSIRFTQFPVKVAKLIHLRYITLSFDFDLDVLPEAVSELWNLQSLVIDTKSRTLTIKANIWKMIQLRHLKTKAEIILAIKGDAGEAGENLQTMSRLSPQCRMEEVFNRASNLKKLGIRGNLAILLSGKHSLAKLSFLENLKLINDVNYESVSEKPLSGLPPTSYFPQNIKRLTLSSTYLDWKHMSTLGMIGTLQVLKLKDYAFKGKSWRVDGGFRYLQFLVIEITDLVNWELTSDGQFPHLSNLVLKNCVKLCKIPFGLAKSLQILDIEYVPKSAVASARKIDEEKKKEMQGLPKRRGVGFKLSIGAGCE